MQIRCREEGLTWEAAEGVGGSFMRNLGAKLQASALDFDFAFALVTGFPSWERADRGK